MAVVDAAVVDVDAAVVDAVGSFVLTELDGVLPLKRVGGGECLFLTFEFSCEDCEFGGLRRYLRRYLRRRYLRRYLRVPLQCLHVLHLRRLVLLPLRRRLLLIRVLQNSESTWGSGGSVYPRRG